MKLKYSRNVIHLAITENTALRIIIYIAKNKIDWYNDNGLHALVLEALYPVIVNNLVKDQGLSLEKRQKEGETNRTIQMDGFRILYRFMLRTSQSTLIKTEKEFNFSSSAAASPPTGEQDDDLMMETQEEEDAKPRVNTKYSALSVYPLQLVVSIDDELFVSSTNTLDAYFQIL